MDSSTLFEKLTNCNIKNLNASNERSQQSLRSHNLITFKHDFDISKSFCFNPSAHDDWSCAKSSWLSSSNRVVSQKKRSDGFSLSKAERLDRLMALKTLRSTNMAALKSRIAMHKLGGKGEKAANKRRNRKLNATVSNVNRMEKVKDFENSLSNYQRQTDDLIVKSDTFDAFESEIDGDLIDRVKRRRMTSNSASAKMTALNKRIACGKEYILTESAKSKQRKLTADPEAKTSSVLESVFGSSAVTELQPMEPTGIFSSSDLDDVLADCNKSEIAATVSGDDATNAPETTFSFNLLNPLTKFPLAMEDLDCTAENSVDALMRWPNKSIAVPITEELVKKTVKKLVTKAPVPTATVEVDRQEDFKTTARSNRKIIAPEKLTYKTWTKPPSAAIKKTMSTSSKSSISHQFQQRAFAKVHSYDDDVQSAEESPMTCFKATRDKSGKLVVKMPSGMAIKKGATIEILLPSDVEDNDEKCSSSSNESDQESHSGTSSCSSSAEWMEREQPAASICAPPVSLSPLQTPSSPTSMSSRSRYSSKNSSNSRRISSSTALPKEVSAIVNATVEAVHSTRQIGRSTIKLVPKQSRTQIVSNGSDIVLSDSCSSSSSTHGSNKAETTPTSNANSTPKFSIVRTVSADSGGRLMYKVMRCSPSATGSSSASNSILKSIDGIKCTQNCKRTPAALSAPLLEISDDGKISLSNNALRLQRQNIPINVSRLFTNKPQPNGDYGNVSTTKKVVPEDDNDIIEILENDKLDKLAGTANRMQSSSKSGLAKSASKLQPVSTPLYFDSSSTSSSLLNFAPGFKSSRSFMSKQRSNSTMTAASANQSLLPFDCIRTCDRLVKAKLNLINACDLTADSVTSTEHLENLALDKIRKLLIDEAILNTVLKNLKNSQKQLLERLGNRQKIANLNNGFKM